MIDVADARHVVQRDRAVGEQRGGENRQRGVLVAGGTNRPVQPAAPFDDECWHVGERCVVARPRARRLT
jgi:hypothetical protein